MRTYILKKRNDVVVFIRNIMDNVNYQDAYDKLVERIDKSLRFVTRIQDGLKKDVEKKKIVLSNWRTFSLVMLFLD